jgi:hypothetical protein
VAFVQTLFNPKIAKSRQLWATSQRTRFPETVFKDLFALSFRSSFELRQVSIEPIFGASFAPVELIDAAPDLRGAVFAVFQ